MNTTYGNLFILKPKNQVNKVNSKKFRGQYESANSWYLNLALGFILILASAWIFINPDVANNSFAIVFIITLFLTGVLEIISSIHYKKILNEWILSVSIGVFDLLVSLSLIIILSVSKPQISTEALTLIIGYVLLYRSAKLISWATELKKYEAICWGWVIVGTILSFLIIWNKTFNRSSFLYFTEFGLLIIGISEIYFSYVLSVIKKAISRSAKNE